jgi:hypothetical protein
MVIPQHDIFYVAHIFGPEGLKQLLVVCVYQGITILIKYLLLLGKFVIQYLKCHEPSLKIWVVI